MFVLLLTLCVTIATNLTNGLLINYTRIGSAFNKLSENIYFYILTLTIMAVVFDLLRAIGGFTVTSYAVSRGHPAPLVGKRFLAGGLRVFLPGFMPCLH